jgi:hypothetical protein
MHGDAPSTVHRRSKALPFLLLALGWALPAGGAEKTTTVAGPQYARGGSHRFWFGEGYRKLWTTPVELEVLDLEKEAGGLTVVRRVGGMQTPGLAFKGADGRSYTFRWIDKDPSRLLPDEWRGTVVAEYVKDQTAASHPGAMVVLVSLAEQAGWAPSTPQRLMVMPDVPELGEHRELFAGSVGTFGEYPLPAHDGIPGFRGATEIWSSLEMWEKRRENPGNRPDARLFLRMRLADLWTGNWDRHRSQWRWAKIPGRETLLPIPEDPDQAFSNYTGLVMTMARGFAPLLLKFEDQIAGMEGATTNGADVDRLILGELDRSEFQAAAEVLVDGMTDEVIDNAVRRLPPAWFALNGEELAARLKKRREDLPKAAELYYQHLSAEVNVHGSDRDEVVHIRRYDDGAVEISVASAGAESAPFIRRRFDPTDTDEVRLYLYAGNDQTISEGPADGKITIRVLGGPGHDTLDDSRSGKTRFYDSDGTSEVLKGRGTKVDERPWKNPRPNPRAPWMEPRDYRYHWLPLGLALWQPDLGLFAGGGVSRTSWGFRKYPYKNHQKVFLGYSLARKSARFDYNGAFRRMNSNLFTEVRGRASGIDRLNYYGLGNETEDAGDNEFHKVNEDTYFFIPTFNWAAGKTFEIDFGPLIHYTDTKPGEGETLIELEDPYGTGKFGELGLVLELQWDTRGLRKGMSLESSAPSGGESEKAKRYTGLALRAEGSYFPEVWDVEEDFGAVEGHVAVYYGIGQKEKVVLAARAGGRQLWGKFPWFEAAFIGGSGSNRGLRTNRFAGESSLYGNLELRLHLFNGIVVVPARFWLFGLADVGRVWVDAEDSNEWHPSFGGGVAMELMGTPMTFWTGIAKNKDEDSARFYFLSGFGF